MTIINRTTAIYPNRVADKRKLESKYGINEFGDNTTAFYTPKGTLFAIGYNRVVYGDHGPYIEFNREHIKSPLKRKFNQPVPSTAYYEWLVPEDNSKVKVYDQLRDVKNIPYAPKGGHREYRPEGYADYIPGKIYVSPSHLHLSLNLALDLGF